MAKPSTKGIGKTFRSTAGFGKRIEYWIVGRMLKEGMDVYMPPVDDHAVDAIVRRSDGTIALIQIKARSKDVVDRDGLTGLTGRQLNQEWNVGAQHSLYHHEGRGYHQLRRFPGALFDYNGYVLFETAEAFAKCPDLAITQDVHVPRAISSVKGYVRKR